jgi:peptidylprolyl isomerase
MIKNGNTVLVHYTGKLKDGTKFDSSEGREPLEFKIGTNQVIPGFENGLIGKFKGDKFTINIPVKEAYGEHLPEYVLQVPNSNLPENVQVGQMLQADSNGQIINVLVKEILDEYSVLDANHSLAGKDLIFDIEIVDFN